MEKKQICFIFFSVDSVERFSIGITNSYAVLVLVASTLLCVVLTHFKTGV